MRNYTNQNNLCQVLDILLFSLNEFVDNKATKQTRKWTAQHLPIIFSINAQQNYNIISLLYISTIHHTTLISTTIKRPGEPGLAGFLLLLKRTHGDNWHSFEWVRRSFCQQCLSKHQRKSKAMNLNLASYFLPQPPFMLAL